MNEVLLGLLGAALGLAFFACGFCFGSHVGRKSADVPKAAEITSAVVPEPTEEEKAAIEEARDRLRSEQNAFHDLLGYNADVAYGRVKMPGKE